MEYDDDFEDEADAIAVRNAVSSLAEKINAVMPEPQNILDVIKSDPGPPVVLQLCERDAQVLRFALGRVLATF